MSDISATIEKKVTNFSNLVSPVMKSVYWQYFGFPASDDHKVLSKTVVVCLLCRKSLTNHGNTTNLRAHIQHRHKPEFKALCETNNIIIPSRKRQRQYRSNGSRSPPHVRRKSNATTRFINLDYAPKMDADEFERQEQPMRYELHEQFDVVEQMELQEDEDHVVNEEDVEQVSYINEYGVLDGYEHVHDHEQERAKSITSSAYGGMHQHSLALMETSQAYDLFTNVIVRKLHNIELFYEGGLVDTLRQLFNYDEFLERQRLEESIVQHYSMKLTTIMATLKRHTKQRPYALCLEAWRNVHNARYVSVYFNYLEADSERMRNYYYMSVRYSKSLNVEELLGEFNLKNCVAVVTNYDTEDAFLAYLRAQDLTIMLSFETLVNKCLLGVLAVDEVACFFDDIKVSFDENCDLEGVSESFEFNEEFPWSFYENLKLYATNYEPDRVANYTLTVMASLEKALKSLKDAHTPYASVVWPFSKKFASKLVIDVQSDDYLLQLITTKAASILEGSILNSVVLKNAALLDPRYNRLTCGKDMDVQLCVQQMDVLYSQFHKGAKKNVKPKLKLEAGASTSKQKESTKVQVDMAMASFLGLEEPELNEPETACESVVAIASELKLYQNTRIGFEESPYQWWRKVGSKTYAYLSEIAPYYQCIPVACNTQFKRPLREQIETFQQRAKLGHNLVNEILFLHHHLDN